MTQPEIFKYFKSQRLYFKNFSLLKLATLPSNLISPFFVENYVSLSGGNWVSWIWGRGHVKYAWWYLCGGKSRWLTAKMHEPFSFSNDYEGERDRHLAVSGHCRSWTRPGLHGKVRTRSPRNTVKLCSNCRFCCIKISAVTEIISNFLPLLIDPTYRKYTGCAIITGARYIANNSVSKCWTYRIYGI